MKSSGRTVTEEKNTIESYNHQKEMSGRKRDTSRGMQ